MQGYKFGSIVNTFTVILKEFVSSNCKSFQLCTIIDSSFNSYVVLFKRSF